MKRIYPILFILIFISFEAYSQSKHSLFINTGYTYNDLIKLNDVVVEKSKGYILTVGLTYRAFSLKYLFGEIGLSGKGIFSSGKVDGVSFSANTLRLAVPTKIVIPTSNKKWMFVSGFVFQNNVDVSKIDFRLRDKYSWRVDFLLETRYRIKNQWYLSTGITSNIRNIPDPFFINDPKISILFGINKSIHLIKGKRKREET